MLKSRFRKTKSGKILFNRDFDVRESQTKKKIYKEVMKSCSFPDCIEGYGLEVHHIHPIERGGKDLIENYILLCKGCHRRRKLHSKFSEWKLTLLVYKFRKEQDVLGLGITSDVYSDEEFLKLLKNNLYNRNFEVRTLEEEKYDEI